MSTTSPALSNRAISYWPGPTTQPTRNISAAATPLNYLHSQRDAKGRTLKVSKLPLPAKPLVQTEAEADGIDQAAKAWPRRAGQRMTGSYVNFLMVNGGLIMPAFGDAMDEQAANILSDLCPNREVVPVPSREILLGGGNIHCITQQQPDI